MALLFYGRIDFFREQYAKIFDVIGREHQFDIFWSSDYYTPEQVAEFKELYKPIKCENKRIIHEHYLSKYTNFHQEPPYNGYTFNYNIECSFINIMRVFMLLEEHIKETNFVYDLVICTRLDTNFIDKIPTNIPEHNTIYIPYGWDDEGGINGAFAMGSVEVIRKYCNLYKNVLYLLENKVSPPHPENLIKANMIYNKLIIKLIKVTFKLKDFTRRIALLFYGRIDFFREQYAKIFDVIGRENQVDIFWSSDYVPPEQVAEFVELYKPVKIVNERIIHDHIISKYSSNHKIHLRSSEYYEEKQYSFSPNTECLCINLMRVFMLLEEYINEKHITYDLVICTRIDLNCFSKIPTIIPQENTIYIPFDSDYGNGLNNHFAMGNLEVIRKYCYLYKNLLYLLENKITVAHDENITKANIIYNNILVRRFKLFYRIGLRKHDDPWAGHL